MTTPFDRSLEMGRLTVAAEEYAEGHGEPGSSAYLAAWLRFRRQVRTAEDLRDWQGGGRAAVWPDRVAALKVAIARAVLIDGAPMANAQLVDPQTGGLRIVAHSGFPAAFLDFFALVDHTANAACGSALASGAPVWVADVVRSPIFDGSPALDVMLDAGCRRVASVPVTSPRGDVIAMINTHHRRAGAWTPRQQVALELVSASTARLLHDGTRPRAESAPHTRLPARRSP
jgi:GAF domain-containing protein